MKITTFDPMILTTQPEKVIEVFKDLGFEVTHSPVTTVEIGDVSCVRMKHPNGYHIDVAEVPVPQDMTVIRMNVDDFEEAYNILKAHGFTNTRGDATLDTKHSQEATMVSPSGFRIILIKHIKNND